MSSDDKDDLTNEPEPLDDSDDTENEDYIDLYPDRDPAANEIANSRRARTTLIAVAALFVLFFGACAAAVFWYMKSYQPAIAAVRNEVAAVDTAQTALKSELDTGLGTIETIDASAAALTKDIAALGSKVDNAATTAADLKRSVSALYEKETQTSVDWVIAEAEYLVLAAMQRLALERDVDTAIAALRAADERLRSVDHPDLLPIREQLIKDISALEAVNRTDIEGLAIFLAKTIDQVDSLPTKPIAEQVTPFGTVRDEEYGIKDWRRLAYAVWSDLVDLVEVKDADLPDGVLFDPELRYFLQQNLKLELGSARLAVLRRDQANLAASVGLIKRQLDAYYDVDDAAVKSILNRLEDSLKLDLDPKIPNVSGSLDALRKLRADQRAAAEAKR